MNFAARRRSSWPYLRAALFATAIALVSCASSDEAATEDELIFDPIDLRTTEFGFDPARTPMTAAEERGLRNVFGGVGFRMFVPEKLFTTLITFQEQRQWNVYGNPPSPGSRARLGPVPGTTDVRRRDARGRTAANANLGLGFARIREDGKDYVNFTCFECHAGVVAGMTVAGLPNAHADHFALSNNLQEFSRIREFYLNNLGGLGRGIANSLAGLDAQDRDHLMQFALYSETILNPNLKRAVGRGDNMGVFPVWQLLARLRDPAGAGFDLEPIGSPNAALAARERLIRDTPLGPVDPRPWWVRKHDIKSYVYGDTLTEPRAGKDFAINFTVPHEGHNDTYRERSREIADVLSFALATKSPPYPYDREDPRADAATIEAGRTIYNRDCARCHGRVDNGTSRKWRLAYKSMEYAGAHELWKDTCLPDVLYSTDKDAAGHPVDAGWTTDTDLAYSCALIRFNAIAQYASGINPYFGQARFGIEPGWLPEVYNPQKPGYRAPPLVGIWASAPYLHNGSIPTLGDLFNHESLFDNQGGTARPLGWSRVVEVSKDQSYFSEMVGMQYEPYFTKRDFPRNPGLDYDFRLQTNFRRFYDTTLPGKSNVGADTCGGRLDQARNGEKDKVLAFLKEFSDDNVEPDPASCPHPQKPRATVDYTTAHDETICAAFYRKLGVATY